jgi:hypothetical protein
MILLLPRKSPIKETTMSLPLDQSTIDKDVIDYLTNLINSGGSNNPEALRSIAFFFDDKPPRVFQRPGTTLVDRGTTDTKIDDNVTARLQRFDYVQSIVYQLNPQCSWVIVNGRHRLICG